ncbi:MAG TPA: ABC transporter ATP-binding protein [Limnochordia bacterium]|jgi:iron(III) transport system ATP-binding protein|nr:polyamine ABC transporter ATP-binding protein [Bacillota bacterium]HBG08445.1 polyamine ABC transporter ATP-binding protein [Bacillota bacterium]HOK32450.1 ABC transporter ATP-binding protein [Limnochordia bacterium]HPP73085.1 ABC transporter ATP-binding protein [Limnochordia bacterium]
MAQVQVELRHVTKKFTTKTLGDIVAVDDFSFQVYEGECFSILGPSGCGKTTCLRMIAGFEDLTEGEIYLSGRPVSSSKANLYVPPEERDLGMVFQAFAVWPHMTVFENVAFPLRIRKVNRAEVERRVKQALQHTSLAGLEDVYPSDLSGGQQQRIALARAIVTKPKVMLLDEPLSNLDPHLRETMRFELKELQRKLGFTIIFVTHDQSEAMAISDRMLVADMGKIMQIDTPENLYNRPINRFVHSFLGESTFLKVVIKDGQVYAEGDLEQPLGVAPPPDAEPEMILATRPNAIEITGDTGYQSRIETRIFLTDRTEYLIPLGSQKVKVQTPHRIAFSQGDSCRVRFVDPMWYPVEDSDAEKERARRQLI